MPNYFSTKDVKCFAATGLLPLFLVLQKLRPAFGIERTDLLIPLVRRFSNNGTAAAARLRRNVFLELILAAGVIIIVAVLGILPPAIH